MPLPVIINFTAANDVKDLRRETGNCNCTYIYIKQLSSKVGNILFRQPGWSLGLISRMVYICVHMLEMIWQSDRWFFMMYMMYFIPIAMSFATRWNETVAQTCFVSEMLCGLWCLRYLCELYITHIGFKYSNISWTLVVHTEAVDWLFCLSPIPLFRLANSIISVLFLCLSTHIPLLNSKSKVGYMCIGAWYLIGDCF